jgi:ligand-binding sensor protein
MELTDILPIDQWVEFEKEIVRRTGLDSNVFNTDGVRISGFRKWANRLCPAIKATDRGQSFICAVAHMNLAIMAQNTGNSVIEECDAGILKLVVPIFVNDTFIGAVGACGLLLDDGEVDTFMVHKTIDMDESQIENLAEDIGSIAMHKVEDIRDYIENRLDEIVLNHKP